jgi:hypothetical protein
MLIGGSFKLKCFVDSGINSFFEGELFFLSGNNPLDTFKKNMVFFARLGTKNPVRLNLGARYES